MFVGLGGKILAYVKDTDMISTPPIKSFSRELQAADHAANNKDQTAYKASKESTAL